MSENEQPKEYNLKTISDIFDAVNIDNIDNFLKDFEAILRMQLLMADMVRLSDEEGKYDSVKNSEIIKQPFLKWIDDGKHKITINLKATGNDHQ